MSNMDRIRNNHLRTAEVFNRLEEKKVIKGAFEARGKRRTHGSSEKGHEEGWQGIRRDQVVLSTLVTPQGHKE